jgi:alkaline phosphatase
MGNPPQRQNYFLKFFVKRFAIITKKSDPRFLSSCWLRYETGMVKGSFSKGEYTRVMAPVFAYGSGAENFTGIMENTDIAKKIMNLMNF